MAPDGSATHAAMPAAQAPPAARSRFASGRLLAGALAIALVAAVGAWRWMAEPAIALTNRDSILVGGFANATGDAVFDETLSMALKVQLGQSPFLTSCRTTGSPRSCG